jgi:hypothetical protein
VRQAIEASGTQVAFVHMSPADEADRWFEHYGLADVVRIGDPEKTLYRQFGLDEGRLLQLAAPAVWLPWFRAAILDGRGVGAPGSSWRQLSGVFVVRSGQILAESRHRHSAVRPDYLALIASSRSGRTVRA